MIGCFVNQVQKYMHLFWNEKIRDTLWKMLNAKGKKILRSMVFSHLNDV